MKRTIVVLSLIAIVATIALLLLPITKSRNPVMIMEDAEVEGVGVETASIAPPLDREDIKQIEDTPPVVWSAEQEAFFAPLIAESQSTTVEFFRIEDSLVDGKYVTVTNKYTVPKRIPVDINVPEVAEYVQIAWTEARAVAYIPDGIVPTAIVIRDNIIVNFPWLGSPPPESSPDEVGGLKGSRYYSGVAIDIKTKTVKAVLRR